MKYLLLSIIGYTFLLFGCSTDSREKYIKEIVGSMLTINSDLMLQGSDSELYSTEIKKPLKIVIYSDSTNCNACDIRFPMWKIKYKELSLLHDNIGLIFIINTENISDIELNINVTKVPGLKLYDTNGDFKKNNHIFNNRAFHVFLLDQDNKVILVGNPLDNHKLFTLYKEAIKMYTNQK